MKGDLSPDAAAELRILRAEVRALHQHVATLRPPGQHGWLKHVIKGLEDDPHVQYRVHLYGTVYWLANFPLVTVLFFFAPSLWLKLGIFITLVYSIYANLATDYGAMSAAMAAFGQSPLPEIPVQEHVDPPGGSSSVG